jgi:hypothetical protein
MDDPLTAPLWLSLNVATGGLLGLYDFFSDNDYLFWNQDQELFAPPFSYMKVKGYVPGIKYDLRDFERYEGLIESVDIFISPEVGIMNIENANVEDAAADSFKGITPSPIVDFEKNSRNPGWMNVLRPGSLQSPISDPGEALNNITERGEFFLVKSLKLGSKSGSGDQAGYEKFPSLDDRETIYNIRNLVHQELLEDNDAGIHRFGSDGTYSYNRRMHWYGVTQEYFRGFDWNFFKWEVVSPDQDGGYEIKRRVITRPLRGQENDSRRSVAIDPDDDYTDYNGIKSKYSMLMAGKSRVILETVIETKGKVYSSVQMEDRIFGSAMISYPDANAKKITIYFQEPNDNVIAGGSVYGEKPLQKVMELPLTEHKRLNLAYYLTPQLEPVMGVKSETAQHLTDAIINRPLLSVNANELRVSETDNPLEVQYQNIMHIGNDRILGIGANVMNVSGQNFGQFPLFVITDSGVYALATGVAEAAYTNMHHIAFGEPATSGLTCQTPAGLIYVGANGLYFINGTKAELLTKAVEQNPDRLHLEYKPVMDAPLRLFTGDDDGGDFKTYIRKADNMWYDNINNELSIWKAGTVGWTVGLDNGVIYRNSLLPAMAIKNTANNAMWIDRLNVLDMLSTRKINDDERPVTVDVNFITRPMNYGTPDTKTLNRIILRGILYGENKTADVNNKFPVIVTWRSNDNRNFIISKGLLLKECNYRSIDTGNYFMQKFRSYIVAFGGKMADGTKITMIESEIEKSYPFSK